MRNELNSMGQKDLQIGLTRSLVGNVTKHPIIEAPNSTSIGELLPVPNLATKLPSRP